MDNQLSQYDEIAIRHRAAFAAFKSIYEDKNPPPVPAAVEHDSLFVPIALVIMIVASVIVSGSRTIIEFGGGIVGAMAFVMLEGAIVAYAFYRTRRNFSEHRMEGVRKLANFGLGLAFTVAVGANIHAVLKEKGVELADGINTAILIMVGISAPTLAFISGDILAVETMANTTKDRKNRASHQVDIHTYNEDMNAAWAREKSRWGIKIEVEPQRQVEAYNSSNLIKNNELTRFKPSPKLQKALDYLRQNEGELFTPPRELELKITGISYGTIHKAQMIIRSEKQNDGDSE